MTDVPADLVGKYDVVNIRFFIFVVPIEKGPKEILEKLVKLLSISPFACQHIKDVTKDAKEGINNSQFFSILISFLYRARWFPPMGRSRRFYWYDPQIPSFECINPS